MSPNKTLKHQTRHLNSNTRKKPSWNQHGSTARRSNKKKETNIIMKNTQGFKKSWTENKTNCKNLYHPNDEKKIYPKQYRERQSEEQKWRKKRNEKLSHINVRWGEREKSEWKVQFIFFFKPITTILLFANSCWWQCVGHHWTLFQHCLGPSHKLCACKFASRVGSCSGSRIVLW